MSCNKQQTSFRIAMVMLIWTIPYIEDTRQYKLSYLPVEKTVRHAHGGGTYPKCHTSEMQKVRVSLPVA